jgi:uncharacterized protein (TIGR03089 family)
VHQLSTPERQFAALLAAEPARPFVTYYDEVSGERSELSAKSMANWVAKTYHLLVDELGLGVGDTALVALPAHWISVPVLLGCLTAGLSLSDSGSGEVAFVSPSAIDRADAADVYAIAPSSAALGFGGSPPDGTQDYVTSVRPHEDKWPSVQLLAGPSDPCLPGLSRGEVAARRELEDGARLLWTAPWDGPDDWLRSVFDPLAVGGSLVIVANCPDQDVLDRRASQERVTARG